jgi:hypothetical protein
MALTLIYNARVPQITDAQINQRWEYVETTFTWNMGTPFPELKGGNVVSIAADGDERAFIIQKFANIVHCELFCIWTGEIAEFIYQNLKHLTK